MRRFPGVPRFYIYQEDDGYLIEEKIGDIIKVRGLFFWQAALICHHLNRGYEIRPLEKYIYEDYEKLPTGEDALWVMGER